MANVNKITPATFELAIANIPNTTTAETAEVVLQIFNTVIPSIDMSGIDVMWMATRAKRDSAASLDFQDWNISFFINSDFSNWKTLHDWMEYSVANPTPSSHETTAVLSVKNNFGVEVIKVFFANVWIKSLGEVTFNFQGGDDFLQGTAIFEYSRFDVYMPLGEITS